MNDDDKVTCHVSGAARTPREFATIARLDDVEPFLTPRGRLVVDLLATGLLPKDVIQQTGLSRDRVSCLIRSSLFRFSVKAKTQ